MNIQRILVPYDFSNCSAAALDYAAQFANSNARLYIVHVDQLLDAEIAILPQSNGLNVHNSAWERRHKNIVRQLSKIAPRTTVAVYEHHCLTGSPADQILAFADRVHPDLIVMGSHGRTGLSRLITGSVAEQVMRRATCPVFVIKASAPKTRNDFTDSTESPALRVGNDFAI